jgi:hypothetical protein
LFDTHVWDEKLTKRDEMVFKERRELIKNCSLKIFEIAGRTLTGR